MAIRIIDEADTYVTAEEWNKLNKEYRQMAPYAINPPTFEAWVVQKLYGDAVTKAWPSEK
jgi:hypothetical protein